MKSILQACRYAWLTALDAAAPRPLPERGRPLYVTFVFHTERIADAAVFEPFLEFVLWLSDTTGARPTACVTTPHCPECAELMRANGVNEADYAARLRRLAQAADIGYHGHFFAQDAGRLEPMSPKNFRADAAAEQMDKEMAWLEGCVGPPRAYCAGWWLLNESIVRLLDARGVEADSSIRHYHANTFGSRYLDDDALPPRGEPFLLPPSRRIIEIPSAFYPIHHPRRTREQLRPTLEHAPDRPLVLAFPAHEGEILQHGRAFRDNVLMLTRQADCVCWMSLLDQAALARREWGLAASE